MSDDRTCNQVAERLRAACTGHPSARIPWPHRLLHEAADELERLTTGLYRCREALGCLLPALLHDKEIAGADDDHDALQSRIDSVRRALRESVVNYELTTDVERRGPMEMRITPEWLRNKIADDSVPECIEAGSGDPFAPIRQALADFDNGGNAAMALDAIAVAIDSDRYRAGLPTAEEGQRPSTEDYEYVVHHAEVGWDHLARAVRALFEIAEGDVVEPARHARLALFDLPTCGVYESAAPEESGPLMSYKEAYEALAKSIQESHDWMTRDVVPQLKKHGIHIEGLTDRDSEDRFTTFEPKDDMNPQTCAWCLKPRSDHAPMSGGCPGQSGVLSAHGSDNDE